MSEKHSQSTGNPIAEFCNDLENLYNITVDYRTALKAGNQQGITSYTESLVEALQKLYFSREKYARTNPELANMAENIIGAFNDYTSYFNAFVDSTDKLGSVAQENAKKAEFAFSRFVQLITSCIEELKPIGETKKEAEPQISSITINPQISVTNVIENNIQISMVFETAIHTAQNVLTDAKERDEVLKQIEELKNLVNERNNKQGFWNKLKDKLKWLAEKSIQVAEIVVPVVASLLKP